MTIVSLRIVRMGGIVRQGTKSVLIWSMVISVLVTTASVLGLVDPDVYEQETKNWATQARGQDIGNLVAVVALLLSGFGYHKGSQRAGLVWLGALLYLVYAYVVYSMASTSTRSSWSTSPRSALLRTRSCSS